MNRNTVLRPWHSVMSRGHSEPRLGSLGNNPDMTRVCEKEKYLHSVQVRIVLISYDILSGEIPRGVRAARRRLFSTGVAKLISPNIICERC